MQDRGTSRRRFLRSVAVPTAAFGAMPAATALAAAQPATAAGQAHRCGFWIDLASGEPIADYLHAESMKTGR